MSVSAIHDDHHDHGPAKGLMRWVTTTNHKDIGTLYMVTSLIMFMVGGAMALVIRAELFEPGMQFVDPMFFNSMTTLHALIMVFGAVMPAFAGLANWMIPMMIGSPDMALPRLNNWSFWLLPFAALMLVSTLFMEGGAAAAGWTLYPPLVLQTGAAFPFTIFTIHILGVSSILAAINIIVTILNMRAPGMTLMKMPLFVWTWLITAFLLIAIMPVFAGAVTMLLTDKFFGTSFFNAAGGGDPVLYRVKVFNWISTMWKGAITFESPMLWAIAFVVLFTLGGFTGLMMSISPADLQYHDTYFIVAHFHYVLVSGAVFAIIGGVYYWLPKWTGRMYDERLAQLHFWLTTLSVNLCFFPQHFLGLAGMPRRIPDYALQFAEFNAWSSVGAFIFGFSQLIFCYIVFRCMSGHGEHASGEVWEGASEHGLEFTLPSPAPYHTWETPPNVH
ncbi:MAG: cytochrome c oxidase subunit I [Gammaproteobacteria bacterium]|nr:cytochrome c oxidase subunit I [Gammaproteobacteria bacterium]